MTHTLSEQIRELAAQGKSLTAIAAALHWNRDAVQKVARQHGIAVKYIAGGPLDPARLERIRELAAKKDTARQIADALGMTRNAVIASCRRFGIKLALSRGPMAKRKHHGSGMPRGMRQSVPIANRAPDPDYALCVSRAPRPRQCRWITGETRPAPTWCRRQVAAPGLPWCEEHARRAWRME